MSAATSSAAGSATASAGSSSGTNGSVVTTHPSNLVNNGGFEYGLMCYGQYEWGAVPSNMGTGYQFSLSTSAHSGSYALQISCVNASDCGFPAKAAIESYAFHSPANQGYQVSIWANCPSGDEAYFYTPDSANGDFSSDFSCTGNWAQSSFSFTAPSTEGEISYSIYYAGTNTILLDDLTITYADGTVPAQTVLHAGHRDVSLHGDDLVVDGQPFLPLGFYGVPAESLTQAAQVGANVAVWGDPGCSNTDAETYPDQAFEAGLALMPESSSTARLGLPGVFPAVLQQFGNHQSEIAWYLDDEPDQGAVVWQPISASTLTAEYQQIQTSSSLPVGAMLQHAHYDSPTTTVDTPYQTAMDVYLSEPYGMSFGGIANSMEVFATMTPRPVWIAEDSTVDPTWVVPKAYAAITAGATGLFFFDWPSFAADPSLLMAAGQAFTELGALSPAILDQDITASISGPTGLSFIGRSHAGQTFILAVNPTSSAISGAFSAPGLTAGQSVTVQFENRTIAATGGSFSDSFPDASRHVYVLP